MFPVFHNFSFSMRVLLLSCLLFFGFSVPFDGFFVGTVYPQQQTRSRTTVKGEGKSEATARANAERKIQGQIGKNNRYTITDIRFSKSAGRHFCALTVEYSRRQEKSKTYSRKTIRGEGKSKARARADAEKRIPGEIGKGKEYRIQKARFSRFS